MTNKTYIKDVIWKDTYITKIHDNPPYESQWLFKIQLPDWLAVWDVFADWEREHLLSMIKHLTKDDVLFDIGAELGWQSVVFGQIVAPENIVLIEPSSEFWTNIRYTWKKNFKVDPLACYKGFFGDCTTSTKVLSKHKFPRLSSNNLTSGLSYRYLFEHKKVDQIRLDDYVKYTGIIPTALTIDVEGAELNVLKGAEATIRKYHPKVWLSIHPELLERDFNLTDSDVHAYMGTLGYKGTFLDKPNEEHWYYEMG